MTRRSGRGDYGSGDGASGYPASGIPKADLQVDADAEAAATSTAIAGLRRMLKRLGSLENPSVRRELRKLAEEVAELEDGKRVPGRHRSNVTRLPVRTVEQATTASQSSPANPANPADDGSDPGPSACPGAGTNAGRKPDPAAARTIAEFIAMLWQFRAWADDPSWRKIAARAHHRAVHSTIYSAMHGTALPKLIVVNAIILGCGGDDADLAGFSDAWWRIGSASVTDSPADPGLLPAPVPVLS
jgi:hypothetical protein